MGIFASVVADHGLIKSIFIPQEIGELSRKKLDTLPKVVRPLGGEGVAWFKVQGGRPTGGISKFIGTDELEKLQQLAGPSQDGLFLFCAHRDHGVAHACADAVRRLLGAQLGQIASGYHCLWVQDFPLLEYSQEKQEGREAEKQRFYALHHPFTRPRDEDLELFYRGGVDELKRVKADAYDLVINGYEVAGGSMRIYDNQVQEKMFEILGFSREQTQSNLVLLFRPCNMGLPLMGVSPSALTAMVMLMAGTDHIQDVVAFSQNTLGQ